MSAARARRVQGDSAQLAPPAGAETGTNDYMTYRENDAPPPATRERGVSDREGHLDPSPQPAGIKIVHMPWRATEGNQAARKPACS